MKQPLSANPNYHRGPAQVRRMPSGNVFLMCPQGHIMACVRRGDWAGSRAEARSRSEVECVGLPKR
jgi:hypothetical protein